MNRHEVLAAYDEQVRRRPEVDGPRVRVERADGMIESPLVERILNDSSDQLDQLPVLQHCMFRMWQAAGSRPAADGIERGRLLCLWGEAGHRAGDAAMAEERLERGVAMLDELGDHLEAARRRLSLGRCRWERSQHQQARRVRAWRVPGQ